MTEEELKERFIKAILDSVSEHGKATTSLIGAERAYTAIKNAGLLIKLEQTSGETEDWEEDE